MPAHFKEVDPEHPAWVTFICNDESTTRSGDSYEECIALADAYPCVAAVGVNCVPFNLVIPLLEKARTKTEKHLIVYPNSGEIWDAREGQRRWYGEGSDLHGSHARSMADAGASIIGGCCRVTSDQISRFRKKLCC